jgi:DNA-binding transcriptional LysR family regulator
VVGPLRALAATDALVDTQSREASGTVRLTALPGYGEIRLFSVLERFRAAHPRIVCDLELTDRFLDLSTGDIDIALRATAEPPDYLVAKRLHDHRFVLVASPEYLAKKGRPRTVAEVQEHAAIGYRGPRGVSPWLAALPNGDVITVPRTLLLITSHGQMMLRAALAGEGLAFLPSWGVSAALNDGTLEAVTLDDARLMVTSGPEMSVFLLYSSKKARLGQVRALVDFLVEALGE